jgi:hypothetical protein
MGNRRYVKGRVPSKTDKILEYLMARPGEVLRPKDIACALEFNPQTTVTALTKLYMEGTIHKEGRGRYCYVDEGGGHGPKAFLNGKEDMFENLNIEPEDAHVLFETIIEIVCESIGKEAMNDLIGFKMEDFEDKNPLESIKKLVKVLNKVLGKDLTNDVVNIALNAYDEGLQIEELADGVTPV